MDLIINDHRQSFAGELTVAELIARLQLVPERVAVEVNERLVPRATYAEAALHQGDRVEIVTLVGGG